MGVILDKIRSMASKTCMLHSDGGRVVDMTVDIDCGRCGEVCTVKAGSIYRQFTRHHRLKYLCKSCAAKNGWTKQKKSEASTRSKKQWKDPIYAGTIDGKALINTIKKQCDWDL